MMDELLGEARRRARVSVVQDQRSANRFVDNEGRGLVSPKKTSSCVTKHPIPSRKPMCSWPKTRPY